MQTFKAISFPNAVNGKSKVVSISFAEKEKDLFHVANKLSSHEIRSIVGIDSYAELCKIAEDEKRSLSQQVKYLLKKRLGSTDFVLAASDVTFKNSKGVPFQRWYPYIEGYSLDFVKALISKYLKRKCIIYEPFAGTGTTVFASDSLGYDTYYSEVNPFLQFLIDTKIKVLNLSYAERNVLRDAILEEKEKLLVFDAEADGGLKRSYAAVFKKSVYFPQDNFDKILRAKTFLRKMPDCLARDLLQVAVLSSLIPSSFLKKQGDLRFKTKKELSKGVDGFDAVLSNCIDMICEDLGDDEGLVINHVHCCVTSNAKDIKDADCEKIGCVLTSPPYLNGTNYIRNTKLELWFMESISSEADLRIYRDQMLTSGINDVKLSNVPGTDIMKASPLLSETVAKLRDTAYDARIPQMALCYFSEMYTVFSGLKEKLEVGSFVFIDIGDSVFNNVHVRTDDILIELLVTLGYEVVEKKKLRERRSRGGMVISQVLICLRYNPVSWGCMWSEFKDNLSHQKLPYSKKNWGNANHSLCSYQGKLKPAIAYHLIKTFLPNNGVLFDPFCGVGTIPFEAALNGVKAYGMDISVMACYVSRAKVGLADEEQANDYIERMTGYLDDNDAEEMGLMRYSLFGLNRSLVEYYEDNTFKEILLARNFVMENPPSNAGEAVVVSSLLHILHGNRPYALSRRSHPITPYAPTGEFVYKDVIAKLRDKVDKYFSIPRPDGFVEGDIFMQDSTKRWPDTITGLDAVITSPPFFDSTRFYNANWIRLWFCGWEPEDFKTQPQLYVDERQKKDFSVYDTIFSQAKERLKPGGVFVFHLGKSKKCDMGDVLKRKSQRWFSHSELFDESVAHCGKFGIKDVGSVTDHQYLVLY